MADHPSTFEGTPEKSGETAWFDRASLHRVDDGGGILDGAKALGRGTFAEIIERLMHMPAEERAQYAIEKAGDRRYSASEAAALHAHPEFPDDPAGE